MSQVKLSAKDIQPKTVEQLRDVLQRITQKTLTDEQLIWGTCRYVSQCKNTSDELAKMYQNGVKPFTIADVQEQLDDSYQSDDDTWHVTYLIACTIPDYDDNDHYEYMIQQAVNELFGLKRND